MHVIYALRMNHSFGSSFVRHLRMELVRSYGVPARNEVMSSEKYLKATADSMNVFLPGSWPHMILLIPRQCPFQCWGWFF